jgi:antitoxin YefM
MNRINIQEPNPILSDLIDTVNQSRQATLITVDDHQGRTSGDCKQAVLVSLEEWNSLQETLYLSSIPSVKDDLIEGKNTAWEDCVSLEEVEW